MQGKVSRIIWIPHPENYFSRRKRRLSDWEASELRGALSGPLKPYPEPVFYWCVDNRMHDSPAGQCRKRADTADGVKRWDWYDDDHFSLVTRQFQARFPSPPTF